MKQNNRINKYGLFICSGSGEIAVFVQALYILISIWIWSILTMRVYSYAFQFLYCTNANLPLAVLISFLPSTFWDDKGCYFILSSWTFLSLTEKWLFSISKKTAVFASFSLHLSSHFDPVFQKCIGLCGSTRGTFRRLALGRDSLQQGKKNATFVYTKYNNSNDFLYLYSVFQHSVRNPAAANYYLSCGGYISVNLDINHTVKYIRLSAPNHKQFS